MNAINALVPIVVIVAGAGGWYLIRHYFGAPRGFEIALYVVVAILLILWALAVFPALYIEVPDVD